ncbi:MAG: hypothetical protein KKH40_07850, partial [Nanoarchaeota archaeon]|nr:hypothetical protein [Nanoarchaeota archaeon]
MDTTNKTLALLLVAAIVISLGGTMVSLNKLGEFQLSGVTGRAVTTSGLTNLSVTATFVVNLTTTAVDFGDGSLADGYAVCSLNSDTGAILPVNCGTWSFAKQNFTMENVGSDAINITIDSEQAAAAFIGGDDPGFAFKCTDAEVGGSETYPGAAWTAFTGSAQKCVGALGSVSTDDESAAHIMVNVSTGATTGDIQNTITFAASN